MNISLHYNLTSSENMQQQNHLRHYYLYHILFQWIIHYYVEIEIAGNPDDIDKLKEYVV